MGDTIAVSDEANAALKEWGDARGALDHCEKRFRDAETTLHWMTQDSKHFREFSDFDLQDFQAPEEAYAMAYNDGHRDGRNKTGYDPTVVKLDRQTFREAYKMRAESFEAPHAFRDDRCDNCERSVITEQDMKRIHIYRDDDDGWKNEYQVCEPCYGILIEEEDYYSAESFESVTDEWIINRKRSNPLSRHYVPQKSAESFEAQRKPPWSAANPKPNRIIECGECDAKGYIHGRECSKCDGAGFWKIESPKCAICGDWIAGTDGAECDECDKWYCDAHYDIDNDSCVVCGDPMTDSQSMMKHSEDYRWENCDNERSFLISILSDRQLDEFLEFEEDSYSAEDKFESPVSCNICGKTFASFRGLNGHMNAHLPSHRKRAEEDSCYVCKKEVSVGSPETGECDECKAFFHYPHCDKGAGFTDDPMSWFCSSCSQDIVLDRYHAETKLGKDSCCCGATKTNPCACMIQGVMNCNATCPCSLEKKNAESDSEWNCVICGHKSTGYGHNPEPVASFQSGRCCDTCNATVVIPARLRGSFRAEEGSSCPVCGTHTEVIREYFDDDTSWVDLIVCDNCCWMEELEGNEEEYEAYMEEMLAMLDEEPDADLLEKPNVEVDTSWDWSDGVGPPPSQQTLDLEFDAEASSKHDWVGGEVQIYRYDHDAAGYPTIGIPDPRGRREWFCIKCGADALSDVEPTDHDCPGYRPPDDEPPHTETCPHCKGEITEVTETSHYSCPECGENLGYNDGYWEEHPMGDDPSSFPNNLLAAEGDEQECNWQTSHCLWLEDPKAVLKIWPGEEHPVCITCAVEVGLIPCDSCRNPCKDTMGQADELGIIEDVLWCQSCQRSQEIPWSDFGFGAEGDELTDEEKQEGWNQFQEEAASIEDPDLEQIKTLADKYLLDVIDDETPEFFVDPGLEDYYQYILTDPTYPEGGEPEDEEAAAMFEELKHVRYWATILTDEHIKQADTAAKAMMAAGIMGQDKELFNQGMLGLETNNQVQRERELIAQWLAEGGVHEN